MRCQRLNLDRLWASAFAPPAIFLAHFFLPSARAAAESGTECNFQKEPRSGALDTQRRLASAHEAALEVVPASAQDQRVPLVSTGGCGCCGPRLCPKGTGDAVCSHSWLCPWTEAEPPPALPAKCSSKKQSDCFLLAKKQMKKPPMTTPRSWSTTNSSRSGPRKGISEN